MKHLSLFACCALLALASCAKKDAAAGPPAGADELELVNFLVVEPELASSGQPTEEQFAALPAAGYTTVVSLRPADESGTGWEEEKATAIGLRFVRIPVAGADGLTEENAHALDAALAATGEGKALVCCASGNRVGGLLAMRAYYVQGKTPDEALAYGKRGGLTKAEPAVREKLGLSE